MTFIKEHLNGGFDFNWPAGSPDLSPIELLWAILEQQLLKKTYNTLEEKKRELIRLWNSIPVELCRSLISTFDERIEWVINNNGRRYRCSKKVEHKQYDWVIWNESNEFENKCFREEDIPRVIEQEYLKLTLNIKF